MLNAVVGLIVPDTTTVMAPDLRAGLAGIADVRVATMPLPDPVTAAGELRMIEEHALPAASGLAEHRPDVVVFGCSSAAALLGRSEADDLYQQLGRAAGAPVLGVNPCLLDNLRRHGVTRPVLLTPYEWSLTLMLRSELLKEGIDVVSTACLEIDENAAVGQVAVPDIIEFVLAHRHPLADGILVACGNLRAYEALPVLRERLGQPVITANSAVVEEVERWLERHGSAAREMLGA